jgi:RimJ/RimL family protein N-acetyltransferase
VTTPLELADLHLDALYERDAAGYITVSRVWREPAPRLHLFRATEGNRWLFGAGLIEVERERLAPLLAALPPLAAVDAAELSPPHLDAVRALLGAGERVEYRGPAFVVPDGLPPAARAEILAEPHSEPPSGHFAWLREAPDDARPIAVVRTDDGAIASVCHSARSTPRAAEAGIETAPEHRRRGYGAAAVVAWAAAIQESGRVPLYSTSWENAASRALARRLGLVCYGEDVQVE